MKTVDDFLRADAALQVTCCNCDHCASLSARFLKARFNPYAPVVDIPFKCTQCKSERVRLATAAAATAEKTLAPGMHFVGVYDKFEPED